MCTVVQFTNLSSICSNGVITQQKQPEQLCEQYRCSWPLQKQDGRRNFPWVSRTSPIKQGQVGLKPRILKPCLKSQRGIQRVAPREYQVCLCISQFSVVIQIYGLDKSIRHCQLMLHITKILQNIWLTLESISYPTKRINTSISEWLTFRYFIIKFPAWNGIDNNVYNEESLLDYYKIRKSRWRSNLLSLHLNSKHLYSWRNAWLKKSQIFKCASRNPPNRPPSSRFLESKTHSYATGIHFVSLLVTWCGRFFDGRQCFQLLFMAVPA